VTAQTMLDILATRGVHVRAEGDKLAVGPSAAVTAEIRALIAENRSKLLAVLGVDDATAKTGTCTLAPQQSLQVAKEIPPDFRDALSRTCTKAKKELLVIGGMPQHEQRPVAGGSARTTRKATTPLLGDQPADTRSGEPSMPLTAGQPRTTKPESAPVTLSITVELRDGAWRVSLSGPLSQLFRQAAACQRP
jgi:hypothetical protein